ncbi:alpha/beta fold hydrolase [Rhodococcus qingshengii]|uniref:alpha/beta fold hydrolase n=1 Tax=Rhodococcus TaxID=1827 RepID=UPI001E457FE3|nr:MULTISPECIES: alpha/beta fold hydrolase [Rhodococcus]MCD2099595.1 alpha/beta hydrolase [Rhodococcus rhodochrous]MCD2123963.1 alpha/beta hydrolase [Rhodococcus rhodochrous]MCQ4136606.1 alpha/beta hydrolase [Rhodococcus rhodochrous]MDJ0490609.1 alpha/beta fold hydrolase [Rhodococcus qingshengii]
MSLNVEIKGSGPALLMCNGLGASIDTWGVFGDLLAEHFTLIQFDAPGCGGTPVHYRPYAMSELAARVSAMVLARGFRKVHVCGFSFGGMLAQQFAYQFPELVDRLVLISTLSGLPGLTGAPHVLAMASNPWRFLSPVVNEAVAPLLYGGDAGTLSGKRPSLIGVTHQIGAVASWFGVRGIEAPTLVVGGTDDPLTPVANVHEIARRIPNSTAVTVPGAGHLWVSNKPSDSASLVLNFIHNESNVEGMAA